MSNEAAERLWQATVAGDLTGVIDALVAGADIDAPSEQGRGVLERACRDGRLDIVRELAWHGARPTPAAWRAAGAAGNPLLVLLLEMADQGRPPSLGAWLQVLVNATSPAQTPPERARRRAHLKGVMRAVLLAAPREAEVATRSAWGRALDEGIERLLDDSLSDDEVPELVGLLSDAVRVPLPFVRDSAGLALYRLANTGRDVAPALEALAGAVPAAPNWKGDEATMEAASALTAFAAQGAMQRARVLETIPRSRPDVGSCGVAKLLRWVQGGEILVPSFRLGWTSPLVFTDAPHSTYGPSWQEVAGHNDFHLHWSAPGHPTKGDWFQSVREFLQSRQPPQGSGMNPPHAVLRKLGEIVGGIAGPNVLGRKARLVERLKARDGKASPRCEQCAELGEAFSGAKLPPAADRLISLAGQGVSLRTCANCEALFLLEASWDNSPDAPDVDYALSRILPQKAIAFLGTEDDASPMVVIER
jgi:hypothetical protein